MQPSHLDPLSNPSTTALFPSSKHPLKSSEFGKIGSKIFRVGNSISIGKRGQSTYTKIDPNVQSGLRKLLDKFIKTESDKVFPGRFLGYRYRRGMALKFSTPVNVESTEARDSEVLVGGIPPECTLSVFGGLLITLFLKSGILAELGPESKECGLKVPKGLLSRNARNFRKPFGFLLFFQNGKHCRGVVITNSLLFSSPCFRSNVEGPVVDISAATKDSGEFPGLGVGWIESKSISCFHTNNIYCVKIHNQIERGCGNSSND